MAQLLLESVVGLRTGSLWYGLPEAVGEVKYAGSSRWRRESVEGRTFAFSHRSIVSGRDLMFWEVDGVCAEATLVVEEDDLSSIMARAECAEAAR